MALSVNEMRSISVAFYESPPLVWRRSLSLFLWRLKQQPNRVNGILPIQVVGSFLRENTA